MKFVLATSYLFLNKFRSAHQFLKPMETKSTDGIRKLYSRLREANKQAELLKVEVDDIRRQIHALNESEIFKQYLNSLDEFSCSFDDTGNKDTLSNRDGVSVPPSKKTRYDFKTEDDYVVVFTDGACENNGKSNAKAGIGVWFADSHPLNISEPVKGRPTNNTAEIQACIAAVTVALDNGISKLKIKTDSMFTINCMTQWIHKWKKNNWKLSGSGGDVKNKIDLQKLDEICKGLNVKWEHVAGHRGIRGNEAADQLAREGAARYRS